MKEKESGWMSKKEEQQLLQQIHLAYNDVVKTSPEFAQLLLDAYQSIEKGESYQIICTRIGYTCAKYALNHYSELTENVANCIQLIEKIDRTYRGWATII
ncbi:hypothetical protein C683_0631 [Catellicoccus marimammalium M35/04/3]|uniref:Uncharacterized protein n=2 Tax=Catellicoccus TaxID=300418 RepID=K8Z8S6_9ENTE|nr:hypothetical protein C683_0631 [Catellicoccus marimammalium M35/04/3]